MTLRKQISQMVDVLDANGHGHLVADWVPCWVLPDQYSATRALVFYLSDGSGEMWLIADAHADQVHHLKRKDAEDLIAGQEENRFNFNKFRQSRERAAS